MFSKEDIFLSKMLDNNYLNHNLFNKHFELEIWSLWTGYHTNSTCVKTIHALHLLKKYFGLIEFDTDYLISLFFQMIVCRRLILCDFVAFLKNVLLIYVNWGELINRMVWYLHTLNFLDFGLPWPDYQKMEREKTKQLKTNIERCRKQSMA